jgi:hypothetical protein
MNLPDPGHPEEVAPPAMKKRNLTSEERRCIVSTLLLSVKPGDPDLILGRAVITSTAQFYDVNRKAIRGVWQRALSNFRNPNIRAFISSPQKKGNCGRKKKWDCDELREAVKKIPLYQRRTNRSLAAALGIPKSTLFRLKQDKLESVIMPVSIALKPLLSKVHKAQRVLYAVSKLNAVDRKYHDFYDSIHIDEKWFFISQKQLRCYTAPDEVPPEQNAQNRDHLIKVMFLCAIARPRYDAEGNCTFDGKIGMWPFVEHTVAQRRSDNRERGDPVTNVISCNRETYRRFLIDKLLPAI